MINELIEQMGGRAALQDLIDNPRMANCDETAFLARALLAVLDAKPLGYIDPASMRKYRGVMAGGSWSAEPRGGQYTQSMQIYTAPPADSVPDGWKLVPIEPHWSMIDAAINHHEGDAFLPVSLYKAMIAAAPAPGGDDA